MAEYDGEVSNLLAACIESSKLQSAKMPELAVFLGWMHGLKMLHHAHHWQTYGANSFSDHELYKRLYEQVEKEIDIVAEKIVGAWDIESTNYFVTLSNMKAFLQAVSQQEALHTESLRGELMIISLGQMILESYKQNGSLSSGLEQAVGTILDTHETHVYLLQQRSAK